MLVTVIDGHDTDQAHASGGGSVFANGLRLPRGGGSYRPAHAGGDGGSVTANVS